MNVSLSLIMHYSLYNLDNLLHLSTSCNPYHKQSCKNYKETRKAYNCTNIHTSFTNMSIRLHENGHTTSQ